MIDICGCDCRIHLADLMGSNMGDNSAYLRTGQAPGAGQQYAHAAAHLPGHFANQFNKQAEESIKTAVGVHIHNSYIHTIAM